MGGGGGMATDGLLAPTFEVTLLALVLLLVMGVGVGGTVCVCVCVCVCLCVCVLHALVGYTNMQVMHTLEEEVVVSGGVSVSQFKISCVAPSPLTPLNLGYLLHLHLRGARLVPTCHASQFPHCRAMPILVLSRTPVPEQGATYIPLLPCLVKGSRMACAAC